MGLPDVGSSIDIVRLDKSRWFMSDLSVNMVNVGSVARSLTKVFSDISVGSSRVRISRANLARCARSLKEGNR